MSQGIVFASYTDSFVAYAHANTILGAVVIPCELRLTLPQSVVDDLVISEYSDEEDTPIVPISFEDILSKEQT